MRQFDYTLPRESSNNVEELNVVHRVELIITLKLRTSKFEI